MIVCWVGGPARCRVTARLSDLNDIRLGTGPPLVWNCQPEPGTVSSLPTDGHLRIGGIH